MALLKPVRFERPIDQLEYEYVGYLADIFPKPNWAKQDDVLEYSISLLISFPSRKREIVHELSMLGYAV